ncbi:MAG: GAF domain-containing protein [Elusimicrobia bacterium]|nr:GAF domain-containing protein [Elusimicrobiota bacterium]
MLQAEQLKVIYEVVNDIRYIYDKNRLLNVFLEKICQTVKCEAGSIFLTDNQRDELKLVAARGAADTVIHSIPFKIGIGICGKVVQTQESKIVNNTSEDDSFNSTVDTITGFKTTNILCVPMISTGRVIGAVELLNKKGKFTEDDLELVILTTSQISLVVETSRLYSEILKLKNFTDSIMENMPGGFIAIDAFGTITTVNPNAARILEVERAVVTGKFLYEALPHHKEVADILWDTNQKRKTVSRQEIKLLKRDGEPLLFGYSTIVIKDRENNILGSGVTFQDLTKIRK